MSASAGRFSRDNGENRIRTDGFVGGALVASPVTLRAKVRWLRGWPEILLRIRGGTAEAIGRLQLPLNLGTPGQRNSRALPDAGRPSTTSCILPSSASRRTRGRHRQGQRSGRARLAHAPLPRRCGNINVTPALFTSVNMLDNGTGGDAIAGDGIYSATILGQPAANVAAFYIQAVDSLGATNLFPQNVFPLPGFDRIFPNDAPRTSASSAGENCKCREALPPITSG